MQKSFNFFDKDTTGLITKIDFSKVLKWLKLELTQTENKKLMKEIENHDMVNYKTLNNLLKIHNQHINVRFDADIWMIYGK